jgi:hypothetical protein
MLTNKANLTTPTKYRLWRLVYILVFGLLSFGIALTAYFIYQTIYSGIANSNAIISTNLASNTYSLDMASYEKSLTAITQKKQLEKFEPNLRNVFYYAQTQNTSTYVSTSTPQ